MSSEALKVYREKLAFLEARMAESADAGQQYSLMKNIEEIKAKLVELGGKALVPAEYGATPDAHASPEVAQGFDVFLSHNSSDKAAVGELGKALKARGLRVWLAQWEIAPGRPWQVAMEQIIRTTRSAAVLVGRDGLGPWKDRAMRVCLSQFVDRGLPVIPVLMRGVPKKPELPRFLREFTWVDLRRGLTQETLDRLEWGVTGVKPGAPRPIVSWPEVSRRVPKEAFSSAPLRDECRILFLAANPKPEVLALDLEVREIEAKIRAAEHRDTLKLISKWAVRPDDLLQSLNQHKPHVVHFSGHGYPSEGIVLQDANAQPKPVSKRALAALFTTVKDNIRLVVLNACYSKPQAEAIVQVVDCAVGMNKPIGDRAGITFAASFYRALGFGRSVREAFDQGKTSVMLMGVGEEETIELLTRDGVDASEVVLVRPE